MVFQRFGGKLSLNQSVNDGGVCRTAPATLGLFNIEEKLQNYIYLNYIFWHG